MGCEGGSLPCRKDLVRTKCSLEMSKNDIDRSTVYFGCPVSSEPFAAPWAYLRVGAVCNYTSLLEGLISKSLKKLKGERDFINVGSKYTLRNGYFVCPLTTKVMNGDVPFVGIWPCGCILSASVLQSMDIAVCPVCGTKVDETTSIKQNISTLYSSSKNEEGKNKS